MFIWAFLNNLQANTPRLPVKTKQLDLHKISKLFNTKNWTATDIVIAYIM